eukprot:CAMPEP_0178903486 /NCGR_PEP_ID=MMETSP0786-20121207/5180_1 /TAXON_ID=186022 /ORGANISM="Thalassionema frauenfeldii, Strain CCMP 1798" /LENGTH=191 /DNA_ID=CAMNT_0020574855 /DNA_START=93 /DNA_END=668 /DNA_ORIENTATION=+
MTVRSQAEVQTHFGSLLQSEGSVNRKAVTTFLRKAKNGESIVTSVGGTVESQNTVSDDNSYVARGKADGEQYVLTKKAFEESYEETSARPIDPEGFEKDQKENASKLRDEGFLEYKSKRKVWARKTTPEDMSWFAFGEGPVSEAFFIAPWGEKMRVEEGDFLVTQCPRDNPEIYRIEGSVFGFSYAPLQAI